MLEKVKEFIPDLIITNHYKDRSIVHNKIYENLEIQIENYQYNVIAGKYFNKVNRKMYYAYRFSFEFYPIYLGDNFNELINAIKEEMKRGKEDELNS